MAKICRGLTSNPKGCRLACLSVWVINWRWWCCFFSKGGGIEIDDVVRIAYIYILLPATTYTPLISNTCISPTYTPPISNVCILLATTVLYPISNIKYQIMAYGVIYIYITRITYTFCTQKISKSRHVWKTRFHVERYINQHCSCCKRPLQEVYTSFYGSVFVWPWSLQGIYAQLPLSI